jgi:hypothetical protein
MPITLQQLAANHASVTFEFAGESVTVHYAPERVTDQFIAQVQSVASDTPDAAEALRILNVSICTIVTSWDVLEVDGGPALAIDVEHVQPLPLYFKTAVLKHIFEAMTMGEVIAGAPNPRSGDISLPTGSSINSPADAYPSGTSSSRQPATSELRPGS